VYITQRVIAEETDWLLHLLHILHLKLCGFQTTMFQWYWQHSKTNTTDGWSQKDFCIKCWQLRLARFTLQT